jgi:NAD-dependent epimerase/dehydratase family protein
MLTPRLQRHLAPSHAPHEAAEEIRQRHQRKPERRERGQRPVFALGDPRLAPQPMKEEYLLTGPLEPTNEWYAIAKIAGRKMCQAFRRQYGLDAISVLPTNLYGPGDNFRESDSHVLPALIRKFHDARAEGRSFFGDRAVRCGSSCTSTILPKRSACCCSATRARNLSTSGAAPTCRSRNWRSWWPTPQALKAALSMTPRSRTACRASCWTFRGWQPWDGGRRSA